MIAALKFNARLVDDLFTKFDRRLWNFRYDVLLARNIKDSHSLKVTL